MYYWLEKLKELFRGMVMFENKESFHPGEAWLGEDWEELTVRQKIKKIGEGDNTGLTATWYELPEGATELKHLIWHKNMNAQVGEIFRSVYRLNDCPHSDVKRNLNKIIAYAQQELERIEKYETN